MSTGPNGSSKPNNGVDQMSLFGEQDPANDTPVNGNLEKDVISLLNNSIMASKSYLWMLPGEKPTDIYKPGRQPLTLFSGVEEYAHDILDGIEYSDLPKSVDAEIVRKLDEFWAREKGAALFAFELMKQAFGETFEGRYDRYLPHRFGRYKKVAESITQALRKNAQDEEVMKIGSGIGQLSDILSEEEIIEVGGGSGISGVMLAQLGAKCTNFDISQAALNYSEFLAKHYGVQIDTQRGNYFRMDRRKFSDNRFSLAYNVGSFEHHSGEERVQILKEMMRIVRPGGLVMISVPNPNSPFYQLQKLHEHDAYSGHQDKKFPMVDYDSFNPRELLERIGLEVLKENKHNYTQIAPIAPILENKELFWDNQHGIWTFDSNGVDINPKNLKNVEARQIIKPKDYNFFLQLPETGRGPVELMKAWYLLEKQASLRQLRDYAIFYHAFGRKPA